MKECASTTSFSVVVNGSSVGFLKGGNGLRQGDPLSPLLFTLVMEVLTKIMIQAEGRTEIQLYKVHGTKVMSCLIFVDDVLMFLEANENNMSNIKKILEEFDCFTGWKLNVSKTHLYLSKNYEDIAKIQESSGLEIAQFPMKYIGFPLSGGKLKCSYFDECYNRLKNMMNKWPTYSTSFAGRLVLVKSVVNGYIHFLVRQDEVSIACLERMQMLAANFLWGGGKHYMAWKKMALPVHEGGLNL